METAAVLREEIKAALARGDGAAAAGACLRLAAAFPADKKAIAAAAQGLQAAGRLPEAADVLEAGLTHAPGSLAFLEMLCAIRLRLDDPAAALACLQRIAALHPLQVTDHLNFGLVHGRLGDWANARDAYICALEQEPGNVIALLGRVEAHLHLSEFAAARAIAGQVHARDPGNRQAQALIEAITDAEVPHLLRTALDADSRRQNDPARANYEAALALSPLQMFAWSRLASLDGMEGRLDSADLHHRRMVEALTAVDPANVPWIHLTTIAFQAAMRPIGADLARALAQSIDRQLTVAATARPWASPQQRAGRLKVGYLSAAFRDHPIAQVTADLFAAHDPARFDVRLYYLEAGPDTGHTRRFMATTTFAKLEGDAAAMAARIAADGLDVLVYLDGYMTPELLPVLALRPAPVQAFWLGHAGGLDLSCIDYLIADAVVVPPADEHLYTAKVLRLPQVYHCASPHEIAPTPGRAAAGLPPEGFVYCAFNNPEKINRTIFDSWMRILGQVDRSVLWLSQGPCPAIAENLRAEARRQGIAPERLIFADRLPDKAQHLARHRLGGLFLDTVTLNASTTALDSLWAGLPVLTVQGDRFATRIATTFLKTLDMPELICPDLAAYEQQAVRLAQDAGALAAVRARLERALTTRPLFDIAAFCQNLETALAQIAAR